jgi:hypothetical protein
MGVPVVGKRHHGKANTPQSAVGKFGTISKRISGMCGSRRSSVNDQQSIQAEEPAENNCEYSLGALLSRGVASQSDIHARCVSGVCQELGSTTMGKASFRGNQNDRGRALATCCTRYGRDQSQDKVCHVGFVFARRSVGVLWPQSNFIGNSSWNRGTERAKHWRARQCEASEVSFSAVTRRSQTRSRAAGISRPASRVFGGRLGNPSRRTWGTALAGLRVRKYEFQRATFLLLASGWAPEEHKNGSVGKAIADASESEASFAGMEVTKSLQPAGRFRLPFGETEGQQTTRLGFGVEEKDSTGVQEDRHHGSGLAHISTHGGNHAGRDGRTPTDDPRLLATRKFACNQQVSSGNDIEQTFGTRKIGGGHSARRRAIGKQINFDPLGSARGNLIGPKWTQIVFGGSA